KGVWYPVNLLAGVVFPGMRGLEADDPTLTQFHADWFITAVVLHAAVSMAFGVAFALLAPKMRPIPAPMAWGGWWFLLFWSGIIYALMGVYNPVSKKLLYWPGYILSQSVFGIAPSVVVVRSEKIATPPKGAGPEPVTG